MSATTDAELMRRAAEKAETRPAFVAHAVANYRTWHGLTNADMADALGIDDDALAALMLCTRPRSSIALGAADLATIAGRFGADRERLAAILAYGW